MGHSTDGGCTVQMREHSRKRCIPQMGGTLNQGVGVHSRNGGTLPKLGVALNEWGCIAQMGGSATNAGCIHKWRLNWTNEGCILQMGPQMQGARSKCMDLPGMLPVSCLEMQDRCPHEGDWALDLALPWPFRTTTKLLNKTFEQDEQEFPPGMCPKNRTKKAYHKLPQVTHFWKKVTLQEKDLLTTVTFFLISTFCIFQDRQATDIFGTYYDEGRIIREAAADPVWDVLDRDCVTSCHEIASKTGGMCKEYALWYVKICVFQQTVNTSSSGSQFTFNIQQKSQPHISCHPAEGHVKKQTAQHWVLNNSSSYHSALEMELEISVKHVIRISLAEALWMHECRATEKTFKVHVFLLFPCSIWPVQFERSQNLPSFLCWGSSNEAQDMQRLPARYSTRWHTRIEIISQMHAWTSFVVFFQANNSTLSVGVFCWSHRSTANVWWIGNKMP